jgi:hypothetical protein
MANNHPQHENGHRWRKLRYRVIRTQEVCGICGDPVDRTLPAGTPGSPEVDHVVPVSVAPELRWERSNLVLAHRSCNGRKGNRTEPTGTTGVGYFCTRDWGEYGSKDPASLTEHERTWLANYRRGQRDRAAAAAARAAAGADTTTRTRPPRRGAT